MYYLARPLQSIVKSTPGCRKKGPWLGNTVTDILLAVPSKRV